VAEAERQLGPLDILVNNAGISGVGPPKATVDTPLAEWEKTLPVFPEATFSVPAMKADLATPSG